MFPITKVFLREKIKEQERKVSELRDSSIALSGHAPGEQFDISIQQNTSTALRLAEEELKRLNLMLRHPEDLIATGSKVILKEILAAGRKNPRVFTYIIGTPNDIAVLNSLEAETAIAAFTPDSELISSASPLAQCILGKKMNDRITTPGLGGTMNMIIIGHEPSRLMEDLELREGQIVYTEYPEHEIEETTIDHR